MQTINVGTNPVVLLNPNPKRVRWTIQFTPSSIAAGNTGHLFIGRGFIPNAVVGDSNQGDVLNAGSGIKEESKYPNDPAVWLGIIWIVADAGGQQVTVDEQLSAVDIIQG